MNDAIKPMTDEELQQEVRSWLEANWHNQCKTPASSWEQPSDEYVAWLHKVLDARWAVPAWPVEWWGRGLSKDQSKIVVAEFKQVGAPGSGQDVSHLAANTMLTFGQESLKREVIPKMLCAELKICLLYSEPGAGSDLAAVRTRADRDGDKWIINGQKVWTSGAMHADYGLLVARTDWDVPKHKGITFFFCPMKQEGIEIRPIHQITGESHFNEVFIDNAIVPAANQMGELNDGWKVLQTALAYERLVMSQGAADRRSGHQAGKGLIEMAKEYGRIDDPVIRQEIANALAYRRLNDLNVARAKEEMAQGGSSPLMSLGKLAMSRILHTEARIKTQILGPESMYNDDAHADAQDTNFRTFNSYMNSIGGGTDQIQRNIIGERVLGLPREIEVDRNIPFRESKSG